ncbi:SMC family ATPase [uncultured Agrococcus sp.]|uniref:AAA family ATPase n=1 Tax=uncultured Agrococcus sp. TaxID=382258 RepID=UPI0025DD8ED9|nr:SMC family ATPase [uncultured Agrococcus sp.]
MRIQQLTVEGFGPFAGLHTIDFTEFTDTGVYLIGGPTGSGKSSILDAIVFALYDAVPRYDGVSGKKKSLRSDFAQPRTATRVELEFEVGGDRYRIRRSPEYERPKQRGEGFTRSRAEVALDLADGGGWRTLATAYRDTAARIEEIVGLNAEQFQQTILLAQGRFAEFLQANSEDRTDILRRLFGTQRFGELTASIAEEARDATGRIDQLEQEIAAGTTRAQEALRELEEDGDREERDPVTTPGAAKSRAEGTREQRQARAQEKRNERDAAAAAANAARTLMSDIRERDTAREELSKLERAAEPVAEDNRRLALANWALELWPNVTAKDAAERALSDAQQQLASAESEAELQDIDDREVATAVHSLREQLTHVQDALALEEQLPRLAEAERDAVEEQREVNDLRASLRERSSAIPEQQTELQTRIDALRTESAELPARRLAAATAHERIDLFERQTQAETTHATLSEQLRTALQRKSEASRRAEETLRAMLDDTAARLAQELEHGIPCPVCGAEDHPNPATSTDGTTGVVTEQDVDAARTAERDAALACDTAKEQERESHASLDRLREALGNAAEADLLEAVRRSDLALRTAEDAERELPRALERLSALHAELNALHEQTEELGERITRLVSERDAATKAVRDAESRIRSAIGEAKSAAARKSELDQELQRTIAVQDSRQRVLDAQESEERSAAALSAVLGDRSEEGLRAAHLARQERERLEERIREHESAFTRVRAILERDAITSIQQRTADGMPDLAALEEQESLTESAHSAAVGAVASADQVISTIARECDASLRLREELESLGERAHALTRLAQSLDGRGPNVQRMRLETYVLAAGLESILDAANLRLETMTQGRYQLEHDDAGEDRGRRGGLGIIVRDDYTGISRTVQSLSGGETFLTSLALALGLADVVQQEAGGVQLDTLFIDEGFGALDADVLELAMQTLSDLQTGGRTIGVISHVPSMQERLPERVRVRRGAGGRGSTIEFP